MPTNANWRLIIEDELDAVHNMAIDEAMLYSHIAGFSPPTVRFYGWEKPAVSLGFFQSTAGSLLNLELCDQLGVAIVRRITGGRAVLHGHDITFSIVASKEFLPQNNRDVKGSHRLLMSGIVIGLEKLGFSAEIGTEARLYPTSDGGANCFAHKTLCDVCVGQIKVAGAAQVRVGEVLLTQGSIPFRTPKVAPGRVFLKDTSDGTVILAGLDRSVIVDALVTGLAESLGVDFQNGTLTESERVWAERLAREKYGVAAWNLERIPRRIDNTLFVGIY